MPLMDSLSIKTPVNIEIEHPIDWQFYASGEEVQTKLSNITGYEIDEFNEGKPIPSYAITIYGSNNAIRIHDTDQVYMVVNPDQAEDIVGEFKTLVQ